MPTIATTATGAPPGHQVVAFPNLFGWGAGTVIGWIVSGITKAINAFFGGLVKDALNPLLKLLGQTLLTTPDPSKLPRLGPLWENSREIAVAAYALLILAAGILVMAYETVQTRHSIKEIAPRVVVGFVTANMSLLLAGKAVAFANALSTGVLSGGVNPRSAASTLTALVMNAVTNGGIFLIFIGLGLACILLALLVTYVIRIALTVILIAGAPLALMCHALPQTEGIARWWWRAFAGVLAIQLAQSLTLIAALNVFLAKGGFTFFGPTTGELVDLIVTIALLYILFKTPFWILHAIQVGHGRSFLGGVVKGVIAYKTLGLLGLGRGAGAATRRGLPGPGRRHGGTGPGGNRPGGGGGPSGGGGPRRPGRPGGPRPSAAGAAASAGGRRRAGSTAGRPTRRPTSRQTSTTRAPVPSTGTPAGTSPGGRSPRMPTTPAPAPAPAPLARSAAPAAPISWARAGADAPTDAVGPPALAGSRRVARRASGPASSTHSGATPAAPGRLPVDLPARTRPTGPASAAAPAASAGRPGPPNSTAPRRAPTPASSPRHPPPPVPTTGQPRPTPAPTHPTHPATSVHTRQVTHR